MGDVGFIFMSTSSTPESALRSRFERHMQQLESSGLSPEFDAIYFAKSAAADLPAASVRVDYLEPVLTELVGGVESPND